VLRFALETTEHTRATHTHTRAHTPHTHHTHATHTHTTHTLHTHYTRTQGLPDLLTRVVEEELARVPPRVARRSIADDQLWSLVYLPQVNWLMKQGAA